MSKGWESKAVEGQQEAQQQAASEAAPAAAPQPLRPDADPAARRAEDERKRRVQALEMHRERVLSERTSNPHRRSALELALATIELELEQLGWSIKI